MYVSATLVAVFSSEGHSCRQCVMYNSINPYNMYRDLVVCCSSSASGRNFHTAVWRQLYRRCSGHQHPAPTLLGSSPSTNCSQQAALSQKQAEHGHKLHAASYALQRCKKFDCHNTLPALPRTTQHPQHPSVFDHKCTLPLFCPTRYLQKTICSCRAKLGGGRSLHAPFLQWTPCKASAWAAPNTLLETQLESCWQPYAWPRTSSSIMQLLSSIPGGGCPCAVCGWQSFESRAFRTSRCY